MKIKIKNNSIIILIEYILCGSIFMYSLLTYGVTEQASLGFVLSTFLFIIIRRKLFSILCFLLLILCNLSMSYVPIMFMGGFTVLGLIKGMFTLLFIFILFQTKGLRKYLRDSFTRNYIIWGILVVFIHLINALFFTSSISEMLFRLVPLYFSVMMIVFTRNNEQRINEVIISLIAAAILYTFVAYLELSIGKTYFYSSWTGMERYRYGILRVAATLEDANILGLFLLPPIFLLYTNKVKGLLGKWISRILLLAMVIMLVITGSRASLIAFSSGVVIVFLFEKQSYKKILGFVGIVAAVIAIPFIFNSLTTFEAASAGQRFYLIGQAFKLWTQNPLLGIGIDEFQKQTMWLTMCEFARQLVELGILAFILYCTFYIMLIRTFLKRIKRVEKSRIHDASCLLGLVVAYMINSIALDTYYYYIMWILPALCLALWNTNNYKKSNENNY